MDLKTYKTFIWSKKSIILFSYKVFKKKNVKKLKKK